MKKDVWLRQNSARIIYFRYKDTAYFSLLILLLCFLACFILLFKIMIPQIQSWFSIRDEAVAMRHKIAVLRSNYFFMSGMNKTILENNRQTVVHSLPSEKDFGSIIDAVVISAMKSGVSLNDFSFAVGQVSSDSAQRKKNEADPLIKLSIILNGNLDKVKSFLFETGKTLPLSEVEFVDIEGDTANISLLFYSKPYVSPRIAEEEPIRPLSSENNSVINILSRWEEEMKSFSQEDQLPPPSSSLPLF